MSNKKGLAYNNAALIGSEWVGKTSWCYNWAATAGDIPSGMQFNAMLHDSGSFASFQAAEKNLVAGSQVFSFNEPDMPPSAGGSNIAPAQAAAWHQQYLSGLTGHAVGAPAVTSDTGDASKSFGWLSSFKEACGSSCKVDFCNFHWYGWSGATGAAQSAAFLTFVSDASAKCNALFGVSTIWITEFQAIGDDTVQSDFMSTALPGLEGDHNVGGYSYFYLDGALSSGSSPSTLGSTYLTTT